ncbi:MAG: thiamine-phosphate kinase, partial [Nitrospirota bacterium]
MSLDEIGEFGIIQRIRKRFQTYSKSTILGIGDDSAVLRARKGSMLLLTSDMFIEGIHFEPSLYPENAYYYIGYKAIASSVSDIAAMGGIPLHSAVSVAVPIKFSLSDIDHLIDGMEYGCKDFRVEIAGGDTARSPAGVVINVCITGEIEDSLYIKRSGASVSDVIFVTGTLGDSAMGLEILKKRVKGQGVRGKGEEFLIRRHLMPQPRIKEGRTIALNRLATSMIDISDGLSSDLW